MLFQVAEKRSVAMQQEKSDCPAPLLGRLRSLAEQVSQVLDELGETTDSNSAKVSRETGTQSPVTRRAYPPLPHPRIIRDILRRRRMRAQLFGDDWFADPAWDMMLDLAAAMSEEARVSVSSLCQASGVPQTTALRWINQMVDAGLLLRIDDPVDRRRAFIELSDETLRKLAQYFEEIGAGSKLVV